MKRVILLNGPSSSGKSTLAKSLQSYFEDKGERFAIVSIDDFMRLSTSEKIYEDDVFEISLAMCEAAISLLHDHDGVIVDHVITSERIFNQFTAMMKDFHPLSVHVTCPLDVLLRREKARGDRHLGSAQDSYDYLYPKDGYDLEVDTANHSVEECTLLIASKL